MSHGVVLGLEVAMPQTSGGLHHFEVPAEAPQGALGDARLRAPT